MSVVGCTDAMLKRIRTEAAKLTKGCTGGADFGIAMHLSDICPEARMNAPPIIRWCEEAWANTTRRREDKRVSDEHMARYWTCARTPESWGRARGPIGAIHMTVKRIGWQWIEPFKVRKR